MPDTRATYIFSIQLERFHKSLRFHWLICSTRNPEWLVSWGHARSHELAVAAAQTEIKDLCSGRTPGGRMRDTKSSNLTSSH